MGDTPRELSKSNEHSADPGITENKFTDTSVIDYDFTDERPNAHARETTETVTEPVATDVTHKGHIDPLTD